MLSLAGEVAWWKRVSLMRRHLCTTPGERARRSCLPQRIRSLIFVNDVIARPAPIGHLCACS
jgi:hypothetical protein